MAINPEIENVAVLGTGVLGSQIAYQTAYSGFPVTAYDISHELLDEAKNSFERLAALYEQEVDGAAGGPARAAPARIHASSDLAEGVREADLVIESIPEDLELKREVYTTLGELAPEKTIFATNTSMLLPK
jgi:3-hydroxybutyryl-CoA dehydrogenase